MYHLHQERQNLNFNYFKTPKIKAAVTNYNYSHGMFFFFKKGLSGLFNTCVQVRVRLLWIICDHNAKT